MSDTYGSVRQMPCPDCGNPVQPDRDQLCPNCGYPLMFLRKGGGEGDAQAQSIPRSPNAVDDATNLRVMPQPVPQPRTDTRQFPAGNYGGAAPPRGQLQCHSCGYPNDQVRVRCERCGFELKPARPQARTLAPVQYQQTASRRGGGNWWIIVLIVVAVLALVVLALTLLWFYLN
jgi:hypothetical protein